jgi:hypothetical protein
MEQVKTLVDKIEKEAGVERDIRDHHFQQSQYSVQHNFFKALIAQNRVECGLNRNQLELQLNSKLHSLHLRTTPVKTKARYA